AGTLESVLDDYQLKDIDIYGVFSPGSAASKKLRLVLDYLKEYFIKFDRQAQNVRPSKKR
ncbi:MAG: hypothetical protein ACI9WH_002019, partial [Glaciecola sp.]